MVSIMPGIEARAPERTDTSSGEVTSPKRGADRLADLGERRLDLLLEAVRQLAAVGVVGGADLGGDGEARRHRQAEARHLGEVGALAAQQVLHVGRAVGLAGAEQVDALAGGAGRCACWLRHGSAPPCGEIDQVAVRCMCSLPISVLAGIEKSQTQFNPVNKS